MQEDRCVGESKVEWEWKSVVAFRHVVGRVNFGDVRIFESKSSSRRFGNSSSTILASKHRLAHLCKKYLEPRASQVNLWVL